MFSLLLRAFRNHWRAQASNPINLWAAMITMIVNNVLFLYGMWLMIFDGKANNQLIFPYYLTLTVLAYIGWGTINFFAGGLRVMGETIDNGQLEPMLGTPRSPLLLIAISESSATALGDLLQGLLTLILLFWLTDFTWVLRAGLSSLLVILGFTSVFIFAGTLAFYLQRGSSISYFIIESTLSFTMYPTTKILEGSGRYLLYVIPAVLTAALPMAWIESARWDYFLFMLAATITSLVASIWFFYRGFSRYRVANFVTSRS